MEQQEQWRTPGIRQQERDGVYQKYLFAPESNVAVSFDTAFSFQAGMYRDQQRYRGRWKPRKHFSGSDHVPAFDGAEDGADYWCPLGAGRARVRVCSLSRRKWLMERTCVGS